MRLLPTLLSLAATMVAARADGAAPGLDVPAPAASSAPTGASPVPVVPPGGAAPAPAPEPVAAFDASALPTTAPTAVPVVPTQALVEKVGQGDRLFLAGDFRNALFAYQDAVYMEPRFAPARVKLGRAYLALRYPAQAMAQAEAALAADPGLAEARQLLEEARSFPARSPAVPAAAQPALAAPGGPAPARGEHRTATPGPRIYRLTPDADAGGPARPVAVAPAPAAPAVRAELVPAAAAPTAPVVAAAGSEPAPAAPPTGTAAQHYRAALALMQNREWARAVAELSTALLADPKLAVAYSARGSAHFGLGKYREAADDYRGALLIDPALATPVYGLAECYRVLGDGKSAAEMYQRYSRSSAGDVREDLRGVASRRAQELR